MTSLPDLTRLVNPDRLIPVKLVATASNIHATRLGARTAVCGLRKGLPWLPAAGPVTCVVCAEAVEREQADDSSWVPPPGLDG